MKCEPLLTVSELATVLRVSRITIWRWMKAGGIRPSIRYGRVSRFRLSDIEKVIGTGESLSIKRELIPASNPVTTN